MSDEVWLQCRRCKKLSKVGDEWVGWCDDCIEKATRLLGRPPFVVWKPTSIETYKFYESAPGSSE